MTAFKPYILACLIVTGGTGFLDLAGIPAPGDDKALTEAPADTIRREIQDQQ